MMGILGLTESIELMMQNLYLNQIPECWLKLSYPSLMNLSGYIHDLNLRVNFLQQWIADGTPAAFWISGFFFPQAFLTGSLQNFARKYSISIDTLSFEFNVQTDIDPSKIQNRAKDGIYVHGLFLQGARWDFSSQSLDDSKPKELFVPFPVIHLLPTQSKRALKEGEYVYKCPVYKTLTRAGTLSTTGHSTNFVLFVDVPTKVHPKKWIKAGVALFCALRY